MTLPSMIEIEDKIVSTDILTARFACDLTDCHGICCVDGNSGAPIADDEIDTLQDEYHAFREYMTPEGVAVVDKEGVFVVDFEGDVTTPLVNDAECAYAYKNDGTTLCAIEKAWLEGKTSFRKPISCHLYPIRVKRFGNGTVGLNYHRWNICSGAVACGRKKDAPLYRSLREPIIRAFGEMFYNDLETAATHISTVKDLF